MPSNTQPVMEMSRPNKNFCVKNTLHGPSGTSQLKSTVMKNMSATQMRNNDEKIKTQTEAGQNQNQQSTTVASKYIKLEDINLLIRMFAYNIQERFQELDGQKPYYGQPYKNPYTFGMAQKTQDPQIDSVQNFQYLNRKFNSYKTTDQTQILYLQKMVTRIQQIIDFFKQRSKNGHLIEIFLRNFQMKMKKILCQEIVNVDLIIHQIVYLAENGFNYSKVKVPTISIRERRYSIKKVEASFNENRQQTYSKQNIDESMTAPTAKSISQTKTLSEAKPRTISFSAKKKVRTLKQQHNSLVCTQNVQQKINNLYSVINDIDLNYLNRLVSSSNKNDRVQIFPKHQKPSKKLEKDMLKQNANIQHSIKEYQKQYNRKKKKKEDNHPLKQIKNKQMHALRVSLHEKPSLHLHNRQNSCSREESHQDFCDIINKNVISNFNGNLWMARKNRLMGPDLKRKKKCVEIQNLE